MHPSVHESAVFIFMRQVYSQMCFIIKRGFTHIIQLRHDGAAAPHFELDQVEYLLRVAQRFEDVHIASGVHCDRLTSCCRPGEMFSIKAMRRSDVGEEAAAAAP